MKLIANIVAVLAAISIIFLPLVLIFALLADMRGKRDASDFDL